MKKIIILQLLVFAMFTSSMVDVSASDEVLNVQDKTEAQILQVEVDKMMNVFENHYIIDCDSNESKNEFKKDTELKELYKETCKTLKKNEEQKTNSITFMNPSLGLVSNYVEYDLENDLFYIDLVLKINSGNLTNTDLEILQLTKFYFENDFSVNTSVVDEAIEIVYSKEEVIMMRSVSYGDWTEYSRYVNYAKQWVSDKLRNVDKVYEKRTVIDFSDWLYTGYTGCKTIKPSDTDYKKYVKKENCGFLGIGNVYNIYERSSSTSTEYRISYELKAGLFDATVDTMPTPKLKGREKIHLGKTLYYDLVMVPYHGDHEYFEVNLYFNNYYYNNEYDNFITSESTGAKSGELEQTLKYRGKIIGNYRGSRYAYTYKNFEFRDGLVVDCTDDSCFTFGYYVDVYDHFDDGFLNDEGHQNTLMFNFLNYRDNLGDLYVENSLGKLEYSSKWMTFLDKLNFYTWYAGVEKYSHYFRNEIQRDLFPTSLDDFIYLNERLVDDEKWILLPVDESLYHMFDEDRNGDGYISEYEKGSYNLKFVSFDKKFEVVYCIYPGNQTLLGYYTDQNNMGTYNYGMGYDQGNNTNHVLYDVIPYEEFGNSGSTNDKFLELDLIEVLIEHGNNYDNNSYAQSLREYYEDLFN